MSDIRKLTKQISKFTLEDLDKNEAVVEQLNKLKNLGFEVDLYCSQLMLDDEY